MDLFPAIEGITSSASKEELFARLRAVAADAGFHSVSYVAMPPAAAGPDFVTSAPPAFIDAYAREGFIRVDPVVRRAAASSAPFRWSDCPDLAAGGRAGPKPAARRVMETALDFGLTEGLVVPTHTVARGRHVPGFVTFFWSGAPADFRPPPQALTALRVCAHYFHERYVEALLPAPQGPAPLTDRERDCLGWAARGKSASETAEILSASTRTVEHHIASAIAKLGASNRTQAVVLALRHGLITPW